MNKKKLKKEKKKNKKTEVEELEEKLDEATNGWKRALADYENFKKRSEEDKMELVQYASENLILEILPVLDNFQSAYKALPKDLEDHSWAEGIKYIKVQLEDVLKSNNVKELKTAGEKFDPEVHEAIEKVKSKNKKNIVIEEVVKGYKMGDKIIRAAKVKIGD
ncbi:MAG: nucleotide exchange factor GrpE [Parcubacteria group bacterium]|nr:nucleotide exchange factor GrpE [Parcubacteria group bacterium]